MEVSGEIAVAFHGNVEDKGALEANEYIAQAIAADADHVLRLSVRRRGSQGEKGEVERHSIWQATLVACPARLKPQEEGA